MESLFKISQDLNDLLDTIDEQGGEISEEQYDLLKIKQDELQAKLENYTKAIKFYENRADECKAEKQRVGTIQNKFAKRAERLRTLALEAVKSFGHEKKNGSKYVECGTFTLSTRKSSAIEEYDERLARLCKALDYNVKYLASNGILYTGEDVSEKDLLELINNWCKSEYGEDYKPYTIEDLQFINMKLTISVKSIFSLFKEHGELLNAFGKTKAFTTIEPNMLKTDYKNIGEASVELMSCADIKNNVNLVIR